MENSTADIIGIIDADDALHKDAVRIMIKMHQENPECGLIYSMYYKCDNNLIIKNVAEWVGEIKEGKTNLQKVKVSHFKTLKKSVYNKTASYDPNQKKAVDKDIIYKLEEVTNLKFIKRPLYYYRQYEKGISQASQKKSALFYAILARCKAYRRRLNTDIHLPKKEIVAAMFFDLAQFYIRKNQPKKAEPPLRRAIKLNPLKWNYLKMYVRNIILRIKHKAREP